MIRSAFISPVVSLAAQEPYISMCHTSHETTGSVNPVTVVSVALFVTVKSLPSLILKSHQPLFCHVAVVVLVATSAWSAAGAVAAAVLTTPVAFRRESALPVVFWLSVGKVQLDRFPLSGVPS